MKFITYTDRKTGMLRHRIVIRKASFTPKGADAFKQGLTISRKLVS